MIIMMMMKRVTTRMIRMPLMAVTSVIAIAIMMLKMAISKTVLALVVTIAIKSETLITSSPIITTVNETEYQV